MHKYFAKTRILGKKLHYLTQCHSTNEEMMSLIENGVADEGHLIVAGYQTGGKGQRGSSWESAPDQNLLFSILLKPNFLTPQRLHVLNVAVAVALNRAVNKLLPAHQVEVKWPNDIYVDGIKVAGVLIESSISNQVDEAIVGIGLNVNQADQLPHGACSLKSVVGKDFDLGEVLQVILEHLEEAYLELKESGSKRLLYDYHQVMHWRGEIHEYEDKYGGVFTGEIIGINDQGQLMMKQEDRLVSYDVKHIKFLN
ncbi:biotin--[acetyl-CoA-carboxylase] ligase [Marinoscillum sp. MHG1-6]|uniref:biotin--[acetyl-CoA-carboxylase] ligase n=1 Tax=Marinoscillum sp. MHG1-6 TaxID=2959627 RepID=UPI0021584560|nr:biotin--[acetyl-CoA-carboxylase] ligase [Marinoscillum sp. MHG1-6]